MKKLTNYLLSFCFMAVLCVGIFYVMVWVLNWFVPYTPDPAFILGLAFGNGVIRSFINPVEFIK